MNNGSKDEAGKSTRFVIIMIFGLGNSCQTKGVQNDW